MQKLSLIIPVYNEAATVGKVLDLVQKATLPKGIVRELVVVNDCSTDGTHEVIEQYMQQHPAAEIRYQRHEVNRGKGAALRTGIAAATGHYLLIQDADMEYDPEEYQLLLRPVLERNADVVYGSRFIGGKPHRVLFFWHTIGNKFLTFLSNMFSNLNLTDMETCYKLFRREVIQSIHLRENRFGFEPEVTAKIAKIKELRIYEVGISYYGRTYAEGKKINWIDGFRALYCIIRYNIFS
jgi:glycosyltransferase involved in cell wall biosynthesis